MCVLCALKKNNKKLHCSQSQRKPNALMHFPEQMQTQRKRKHKSRKTECVLRAAARFASIITSTEKSRLSSKTSVKANGAKAKCAQVRVHIHNSALLKCTDFCCACFSSDYLFTGAVWFDDDALLIEWSNREQTKSLAYVCLVSTGTCTLVSYYSFLIDWHNFTLWNSSFFFYSQSLQVKSTGIIVSLTLNFTLHLTISFVRTKEKSSELLKILLNFVELNWIIFAKIPNQEAWLFLATSTYASQLW